MGRQAQRPRTAADHEPLRGGSLLAHEGLYVTGVPGRGPRGPLHFDRHDRAVRPLHDQVDLAAAAGAVVGDLPGAEVLQALPQLQHHPLLEAAAGVGARHVATGADAGRSMADAEVEQQKPRRGQQLLARAARPGGNADPGEHIFQKLVVGLYRGHRKTHFARDAGVVDDVARFAGGQAQEVDERSPVPHLGLAADFLLQVHRGEGGQEARALRFVQQNHAGKVAVRQPFFQAGGRKGGARRGRRQRQDE